MKITGIKKEMSGQTFRLLYLRLTNGIGSLFPFHLFFAFFTNLKFPVILIPFKTHLTVLNFSLDIPKLILYNSVVHNLKNKKIREKK
jgi:hypothetical protein